MKTARMVRLIDGTYQVTFPYDPIVVDAIKRIVPARSRTYDPSQSAWIVASVCRDTIHQMLEDVFVHVEMDAEETYSPPPSPTSTPRHTEYHVLHLQPTAPPELVESAYKTLTKLYHPDRGGDHDKMTEINAAVSAIRSRLA